ncbi:MAG: RNA signal recognition particle [Rhodobacteraceae bacterium]|nr:RNA signal recognition particle [Paracoccaceae bacterium]MAY46038.1 RNA signal recognition particle [Paracoccaceae bacterium]QEW22539.1 hypothetical protein LA6_004771 [Marinibacterium anthonyi]
MPYVDGMVCSVPNARRDAYVAMSLKWCAVAKEHGALDAVDCWGDEVPEGKVTSFPMAVQCKDDETVCFSWMVWPDKPARDAGMTAMMQDPRLQPEMADLPFDGKRMIFGGFEMVGGGDS